MKSAIFSVTKTHKPYPGKRDGGADHQLLDSQYRLTDAMKITSKMATTWTSALRADFKFLYIGFVLEWNYQNVVSDIELYKNNLPG